MLQDNANGRDVNWSVFRTKSADLAITLGRGVPAVMSSVENLGKIILAAGENGADPGAEIRRRGLALLGGGWVLRGGYQPGVGGPELPEGRQVGEPAGQGGEDLSERRANGAIVVDRPSEISDLPLLRSYMEAKLTRREGRMVATGMTGLISTAASVCGGVGGLVAAGTLAGGVAVANIWNPIGWGLGAVALAGGIAITGYVVYRWWTRDKRHEKRRLKNKIASPEEFADRLLDFARMHDTSQDPLYRHARSLLHAFGVSVDYGSRRSPCRASSPISVMTRRAIVSPSISSSLGAPAPGRERHMDLDTFRATQPGKESRHGSVRPNWWSGVARGSNGVRRGR